MPSNPEDLHSRSSRAFWAVLVISALMVAMIAGAALTVTPGLAKAPAQAPKATQPLSWSVVNIAKPTSQPLSWSVVNIAKPTYTPSPSPTLAPTATGTPQVSVSLMDATSTLFSDNSNTSSLLLDSQDVNQVSSGGKYILVSITEQHLSAYENGQLIYSFVASTGMRNSTRVGTFYVLDKIPNAYGSTWDIWMPDWLGIYYSGGLENGIHALPILPSGDRLWSGYLGTPISFGCVVLGVDEALQLYNWADVGTPVEIRW